MRLGVRGRSTCNPQVLLWGHGACGAGPQVCAKYTCLRQVLVRVCVCTRVHRANLNSKVPRGLCTAQQGAPCPCSGAGNGRKRKRFRGSRFLVVVNISSYNPARVCHLLPHTVSGRQIYLWERILPLALASLDSAGGRAEEGLVLQGRLTNPAAFIG